MTVTYLPPDVLKKSVFDLINGCREGLKTGNLDMSQVEKSIRAFCESVAALPEEEGKRYKQDLNELLELVCKLGEELVAAREKVRQELERLEHLRRASVAYQSSDGILPKRIEIQDDNGE